MVPGAWKWFLEDRIGVNLRNRRWCRLRLEPGPGVSSCKLITVLLSTSLSQYLRDPAQYTLEALDQDSPDDAWDSVSEVSSSEQEERTLPRAEDAPPALRAKALSAQPAGAGAGAGP